MKRKKRKLKKNWRRFWKLGVSEWNTSFFSTSHDGKLTVIEDSHTYNLADLAKKYGTPLQVILPSVLKDRIKALFSFFQEHIKTHQYKGKFYYHYPMKVNQNREFVQTCVSNGANLEVTSANELWVAKKIWKDKKLGRKIRVLCNGPKTDQYLALIEKLQKNSMNVVPIIENPVEIKKLLRYKGDIGVRVDLSIKTDSRWDKKFDRFGFSEEDIMHLPKIRNLKILHYHLGSQIKTQGDILKALKYALAVYIKLQRKHPTLDTLDIGGGFGISHEKKGFYNANTVSGKIISLLKTLSDKAEIKHPHLIIEWGWYIADPAQVTIYKIISEKPIPKANAKAWYIINGSFQNDLKDTWAIHQKFHTIPVNNMHDPLKKIWLAGSTCDSDDKYTAGGNYILLPKLQENRDQFVAVLDTGAYQDGLASHHCLLSAPAKIVAKNGVIHIARRRETPESIGRLFGWKNGN